jgi:TolA-binding protein
MRRFLPLIVACTVLSGALPGFSEIFVVFSSGGSSVDIHGNGSWIDAEVDMELERWSRIRTGADGSVEIDMDGELISIGPNRFAAVDELQGKVEKKRKAGFLKGLMKYTKQMSSGSDKYTDTALAGVRGAAHDEDELEWFDESDFETDLEQSFAEGMNHFNEGAYSAAIEIFESLVDEFGENARDGEVAYYLGLSLFNVMRFDESARYLSITLRNDRFAYHDVALMHLSVCRYFLRDYAEAIDGFIFFTDGGGESDLKPYALLMLGKCYREKGELTEAERYFIEVSEDYSGTEFSDTASQELETLRNNL